MSKDQKQDLSTSEYWAKWKRKMSKCIFHVDLSCPKLEDAIMAKIVRQNGKVERFFSNVVTHLVVARVPSSLEDPNKYKRPRDATLSSGVLIKMKKAKDWNITILTVSDISRILRHVSNPSKSEKDLSTCLKEEKMYGLSTSHIDPTLLSPADFHAFKDYYILVEDATGRHRPILKKEYKKQNAMATDPPTWPILNFCKVGRCPFIPEPNPVKTTCMLPAKKKKWTETMVDVMDLESKENRCYSKESGLSLSQPSTVLSTKPSMKMTPKEMWSKLDKRTVPSFKRSFPLKEKPVPLVKEEVLKGVGKPGYCENCMMNYDTLAEHIKSSVHRNFAKQSKHYAEIDQLIKSLQRKEVEDPYFSDSDDDSIIPIPSPSSPVMRMEMSVPRASPPLPLQPTSLLTPHFKRYISKIEHQPNIIHIESTESSDIPQRRFSDVEQSSCAIFPVEELHTPSKVRRLSNEFRTPKMRRPLLPLSLTRNSVPSITALKSDAQRIHSQLKVLNLLTDEEAPSFGVENRPPGLGGNKPTSDMIQLNFELTDEIHENESQHLKDGSDTGPKDTTADAQLNDSHQRCYLFWWENV